MKERLVRKKERLVRKKDTKEERNTQKKKITGGVLTEFSDFWTQRNSSFVPYRAIRPISVMKCHVIIFHKRSAKTQCKIFMSWFLSSLDPPCLVTLLLCVICVWAWS